MRGETRLRELLTEIAPPPEVPEAQIDAARIALHAAYRDVARPVTHRRRWSLAGATAAIVVVVVAVAVIVPGSTPSVNASLAKIARATRALEAADLPAGHFVYSRLDRTVLNGRQIEAGAPESQYLLSETVDRWVHGAVEETTTTVRSATFFDPDVEAAYYAAGLDIEDGVGETTTRRVSDIASVKDITKWSGDTSTLRRQIDTELATAIDPVLDEDIRTLRLVQELMDPRLNAPPALRAALIEIVGGLDVETTELADGSVQVAVEYEHPGIGSFLQELEFDSAGYLRVSRLIAIELEPALPGVPRRTVVDEALWSRPSVVGAAGDLPKSR